MDATLDSSAIRRAALGNEGAALTGKTPPRDQRADAARQFEGYLLKLLLSQMRKTVGEGGLFQGESTRSYQPMFDDALATRAAERGAFGLADQLLRQWERMDPEPKP